MTLELFDSHTHLDFPELDAAKAWEEARACGVKEAMIPGYAPSTWARAATIAREADGLQVAVGVHPFALDEVVERSAEEVGHELLQAANDHAASAIGECGLHRPRGRSRPDGRAWGRQLAVLRAHLEAARSLELPIILHCVGAYAALLEQLDDSPGVRGVVHAFSGSFEVAKELIRRGFYLGFGHPLHAPGHERAKAVAQAIPLEYVLLETDSPAGARGSDRPPSGPAELGRVAEALAGLRGEATEDIAARTSSNARALFGSRNGARA